MRKKQTVGAFSKKTFGLMQNKIQIVAQNNKKKQIDRLSDNSIKSLYLQMRKKVV